MSGDVRKRREKKRKKEDLVEETPLQQKPVPTIPISPNDDITIHVHKESSTGGGICAKFVFFILLAILAVLIGLIITEHRGLTDLDTAGTESRFSQFFDGWVEEKSHHEPEDEEVAQLLNNPLPSKEDDHDEDDHEEDSQDHGESKEDHASDEDNSTVVEDDSAAASVQDESAPASEEDQSEPPPSEEEDQSDAPPSEEDKSDQAASEGASREESEEAEVSQEPLDESPEDFDESQEVTEEGSPEGAYDEGSPEGDYEGSPEENAYEQSPEEQASEDQEYQDDQQDYYPDDDKEPGSDEKGDDYGDGYAEEEEEEPQEPPKAEEKEKSEEIKVKEEGEKADDKKENEETVGVAKIGVGVALLVVAYVVLVRKWKNESNGAEAVLEKKESADLTRRNTIVVPPPVQQVEQELDNLDEDYSDEGGQESEEEIKFEPAAKQKYQDLRSTYTRTLTPESEEEVIKKPEQYEEYSEDEDEDDVEYDDDPEEAVGQDEEEEDSDIDEDLLRRLKAKYGGGRQSDEEEEEEEDEGDLEDEEWKWDKPSTQKEVDSESDGENAKASNFDYSNITNPYDYKVKEDLDKAEKQLHDNPDTALEMFKKILERKPLSPRALYGIARSNERRAELKPTYNLIMEAVNNYLMILRLEGVPDVLYLEAFNKALQKLMMLGKYNAAISVHKWLIDRYPNIIKYKNQLVVTYLTINKISEARKLLLEIFEKWPNDGFAMVHYGFILKTVDNDLKGAIDYISRGIRTKEPGVIDGRFYFHLGDAFARIGRKEEAEKVYIDGVKNKLFLSKYQRSLYNVDRLKGKPWWEPKETPYLEYFRFLEKHWKDIRKEGLALLNEQGYFKDEAENLKDKGEWKQLELYARGVKNKENCNRCPFTCGVVEALPDARRCKRGQIKFSVMHPGTHVWPHCGPTNCRLRAHLGLKVPPHTYIRVAEETRSWQEGRVFIFDDSFEHEVWHNGTDFRLVLIVDVWHPELTAEEKKTLRPI